MPSKDLIVRLLTIVFTPIVASFSAYGAKYGLNLPTGDVVTLSALGGAGVLITGLHWLQRQPLVVKAEQDLERLAGRTAELVNANPTASAAVKDLESKLDTQHSEIIAALGKTVGAAPSIVTVLQDLADAAWKAQSQVSATPVQTPSAEPATNVVPLPGVPAPVAPGPVSA